MLHFLEQDGRREESETAMEASLRFIQVPPSHQEESLSVAVKRGLARRQKELPSRFFYDIDGSRLFERITRLPEYYLTRCETEILERYPGEIVAAGGADFQIVEFGSGSSEKTRLILRAAVERQDDVEYVPIDISSEFLRVSSEELLADVPGLRVTALAGDYLDALKRLPHHNGSRLFLFLGSTIGNFELDEAVAFLTCIRETMRPQDRLLVGVDLKKSPSIVEPAYNDAEGVTAQFNKNILVRINRELCGHFDLSLFEHHAPWIEERSRIEMRLVSKQDQIVAIDGLGESFTFREGEYIHTENSHKWSPMAFAAICHDAGLMVCHTWHDTKHWFALNLLQIG
ncbi:MAG TPA: L-histidine N(alpha)-methyltransferase [Fimbriimonadaceae bacterium]|nr:L-histidine N(alpha)-methyltransferase [Fimbriimonadaceae bacterium]